MCLAEAPPSIILLCVRLAGLSANRRSETGIHCPMSALIGTQTPMQSPQASATSVEATEYEIAMRRFLVMPDVYPCLTSISVRTRGAAQPALQCRARGSLARVRVQPILESVLAIPHEAR